MHINNEIGNITDIDAVSKICKKYNSLFHSDTVQSVGHYDLDFEKIKRFCDGTYNQRTISRKG